VLASDGAVSLGVQESGGNMLVVAANDDGSGDVVTLPYVTGQPVIAMWRHGGGNLKVGVNDLRDSALASVASGNTASLTGTLIKSIGSNPWNGQMQETMVFNTTVSESDCLDLASYLTHKWAGTVYVPSGFRAMGALQSEWAFAAVRFLEISQLVWTDAEIAAKHRAMAAVV
jgi:hypothetical protein